MPAMSAGRRRLDTRRGGLIVHGGNGEGFPGGAVEAREAFHPRDPEHAIDGFDAVDIRRLRREPGANGSDPAALKHEKPLRPRTGREIEPVTAGILDLAMRAFIIGRIKLALAPGPRLAFIL